VTQLILTQEKQCALAVVTARPLEGKSKPPPPFFFDIYVARAESTLDTQQEWVMVEARIIHVRSGYYEQASQACNQINPR
jgi:hypothetical protein